MSDEKPLINVGDLGEAAKMLIEKISSAIGTVYQPHHVRRMAKAEVDAAQIKAEGQQKLTEIQRRGVIRLIEEEGKKQENIESITQLALRDLKEGSTPDKMEDDWISYFFEKCRIISDQEMQGLWGKVLAGEANSPGRYSKHTVNLLARLDKSDAQLFTNLCSFTWFTGELSPLIYDINDEIFFSKGITYTSLNHMQNIGLLTLSESWYRKVFQYDRLNAKPYPRVRLFYYGTPVDLEVPNNGNLLWGHVMLSKIGLELAPICGSKGSEGVFYYTLKKWIELNYLLSSPWPKTMKWSNKCGHSFR